MSARASRARLLASIFRKDLLLFTRDWLSIALSIASVVVFVALYYVLPSSVQPEITIGVHGQMFETALRAAAGSGADTVIRSFDSTSELETAVQSGRIDVGIDAPPQLLTAIAEGTATSITVYESPRLPEEYRGAIVTMVREMTYAFAGHELPITMPDESQALLGPHVGPIPLRDQAKPLFAFLVLIMEAVALGSLISAEVQQRTMTALLATPARVSDVLLSKVLLGTMIAFGEAAIVTLLIHAYGPTPSIVVVALVLGAVLVSGLAMIAGSAGKDLVSTMLLGMIFLIPLTIPGFALLIPGSVSPWVKAIPSYGLVQTLVDAARGIRWADAAENLAMLAAWCVVSAVVGVLVLRRRIRIS